MATVKDLTAALSIGREEGKKDALVATQSGGNKGEDMSGYGSNWPGTMKDQGFGDEPGTDPVEVFKQLDLFDDLVKKLKIMGDENPEIAQAIGDELQISELPSSAKIRSVLKPFTHGLRDYDKEGGSTRGLPDALRIQLGRDAKAEAPLTIRGGRIPNTIPNNRHIDSPLMDRELEQYRRMRGPQLPSFV